ncbi:MAG: hypothetical protein QOJ69_488 [Actinomycetota bacterium]|jgi:hypothetical protein|nr:hypothetical protein [Actinomycetota bacterium]
MSPQLSPIVSISPSICALLSGNPYFVTMIDATGDQPECLPPFFFRMRARKR